MRAVENEVDVDQERERQISERLHEALGGRLQDIRALMCKDKSLSDDEWLEMVEYIRDQVTFKWAISATQSTIKKPKKKHTDDPNAGEVALHAPGLMTYGSAVNMALKAILEHLQVIEVKKRIVMMSESPTETVNVSAEEREEFRSRVLRLVSGKKTG